MTGLSKRVSQAVAGEIAAVLGESGAAQAMGATSARLKLLAAGKVQLSESALERIHGATGKTWRTWLLGAVKRGGASQEILSPTIELVNSLNDAEFDGTKTPKSPKRPRTTRVA